MRRASLTPLMSQSSTEPIIVVEEPSVIYEENERSAADTTAASLHQYMDVNSPTVNPFLLSPWRDPREVRKHSLPTPQCAGITASQVRRLSDRVGEGPSPREAAFLATLSQAAGPSPGGRRHSVVTISKVPTTLFGRNGARRESIAAFPTGGVPSRILGSRRESTCGASGPPSTEHRGSIHNLQLDIMDDIVTARKVRMKMWNTSNERVCEVQPLDEAGTSAQRYTQPTVAAGAAAAVGLSGGAGAGRRYSDFVGTQLTAIPSTKRRVSQQPGVSEAGAGAVTGLGKIGKARDDSSIGGTTGIVCSNTDLILILSNLTSSATEINEASDGGIVSAAATDERSRPVEYKRNQLRSSRSNSFDVSILQEPGDKSERRASIAQPGPSNWFVKRHQPMSSKKEPALTNKSSSVAKERKSKEPKDNKVVWDGRSGSLVDAEALGSAIEVFLRRTGTSEASSGGGAGGGGSAATCTGGVSAGAGTGSPSKGAIPKSSRISSTAGGKSGWYGVKDTDDDPAESCDTSLCSTLKDLFVK